MDGKISIGGNQDQLHNVVNADAGTLVANILNAVYLWAGILCVIVIVVSGLMYATSGGEAAKITKAKNAIFGAVIGIVVIILAYAITLFVVGRF